jgi:hypothetical protein
MLHSVQSVVVRFGLLSPGLSKATNALQSRKPYLQTSEASRSWYSMMSSTSIRRREHHTGAFTAGFSQPSMSTRTPEIHQATASQIQTSHTILALDRPAQLAHGGEAVLSPLQQIPNEQDEIIDEVIMALGLGERSSMGCAYFSTADATLHVAEDVSMATLEVADQFISQIEPTTLLVSARAPRFMLDFLEAKVESQLGPYLPTHSPDDSKAR